VEAADQRGDSHCDVSANLPENTGMQAMSLLLATSGETSFMVSAKAAISFSLARRFGPLRPTISV
jgi:hypothetical protein